MASRRAVSAADSEELPLAERATRARERHAAKIIVDNLLRQIDQPARSGCRGNRSVQLDLMYQL